MAFLSVVVIIYMHHYVDQYMNCFDNVQVILCVLWGFITYLSELLFYAVYDSCCQIAQWLCRESWVFCKKHSLADLPNYNQLTILHTFVSELSHKMLSKVFFK